MILHRREEVETEAVPKSSRIGKFGGPDFQETDVLLIHGVVATQNDGVALKVL